MKKGISLVALVITIIVLIILTATVILTGADAPDAAKQAVFFNDVTVIQEAVSNKKLELYVESQLAGTDLALTEIISDTAIDGKTINGAAVYPFAANAATALNLQGVNLDNFCADAEGIVYYANGVTIGTETFYNRTFSVTSPVEGAITIAAYKAN